MVKEMESITDQQEVSSKLLGFYVGDLLTLAQIDQGKFRKKIDRFELRKAIDEVMRIQHDKVESKQIHIKATYHGFPDIACEVATDQMRLKQMLLNLKATPSSSCQTVATSRSGAS